MKNFVFILIVGLTAIFGTVIQQRTYYSMSVSVKAVMAGHETDTVFIAGDFNNWSPNTTPMTYNITDKKWHYTLKEISGKQTFKFTRGSWAKVQCKAGGKDEGNNEVEVASDTSLQYSVSAWKDQYDKLAKSHTANSNVTYLKKEFKIDSLNTTKRVWIYTPPGYKKGTTRYPVIYMQDGQNLFDEATSFSGEWGIDEEMDSLIAAGSAPSIIVGIDNGPERLREYNPYDNERFGAGQGKNYVEFLVTELKPFIDKRYRTLANSANTSIAGSSMGGLIAYYAAVQYPDVFGSAGVFSPSFWIAPQVQDLTKTATAGLKNKMFFSMGRKEGKNNVDEMTSIMDKYAAKSKGVVYSFIDEEGEHNEAAWRRAFPNFYKWIMASGANVILDVQ